jgi:hypothetical protein
MDLKYFWYGTYEGNRRKSLNACKQCSISAADQACQEQICKYTVWKRGQLKDTKLQSVFGKYFYFKLMLTFVLVLNIIRHIISISEDYDKYLHNKVCALKQNIQMEIDEPLFVFSSLNL